ncbi:hypothetical protein CCYA_CCYA01G0238 [Cyanidiococcus yangmingshanensis]|nr:hypothetical protein CCYA_CCYA01G0238 [Cyanidiococcus yangmingshanensis]
MLGLAHPRCNTSGTEHVPAVLLQNIRDLCCLVQRSLVCVSQGSLLVDVPEEDPAALETALVSSQGDKTLLRTGPEWAHALHELAILHERLAECSEQALERLRTALGRVELLQLEQNSLEYHLECFEEKRRGAKTRTARARAARILGSEANTEEDTADLQERLRGELAAREMLADQLEQVEQQISTAQHQERILRCLLSECVPEYKELRRLVQEIERKLATQPSDGPE